MFEGCTNTNSTWCNAAMKGRTVQKVRKQDEVAIGKTVPEQFTDSAWVEKQKADLQKSMDAASHWHHKGEQEERKQEERDAAEQSTVDQNRYKDGEWKPEQQPVQLDPVQKDVAEHERVDFMRPQNRCCSRPGPGILR